MNRRIADFQEGVARRAAAQAADPRWPWHRALDTLGSWERARAALAAARPSPWGALTLLMIGSFVRSVVEQFAQVGGDGQGLVEAGAWAGRRGCSSARAAPAAGRPQHQDPAHTLAAPCARQSYAAEQDKRQLQAEAQRLLKAR